MEDIETTTSLMKINNQKPSFEKISFSFCPEVPLYIFSSPNTAESFYHSVFFAFKEYRSLQEEEKKIYIEKKKQTIASFFTKTDWIYINNAHLAFVQIFEMIKIIFHSIPQLIEEKNEDFLQKVNSDMIYIIVQLLNMSMMEREVFSSWNLESLQLNYRDKEIWPSIYLSRLSSSWKLLCRANIEKAILELEEKIEIQNNHAIFMDDFQRKKVVETLTNACNEVLEYAIDKSFLEFKENIIQGETIVESVDYYLQIFHKLSISNTCIFIIEPTVPSIFFSHNEIFLEQKGEKTLEKMYFLVLCVSSDYIFHSLAKKEVEPNGKIILHRLFLYSDAFIQTLFSFVRPSPLDVLV